MRPRPPSAHRHHGTRHRVHKLRLLVTGGLSLDGPARAYVTEQQDRTEERGYLEPGDEVDQVTTGLGRQRRQMVEGPADARCKLPAMEEPL